jgi:hypothetical protein
MNRKLSALSVVLSAALLAACGSSTSPAVPANLVLVSGNNQTGQASSTLALPLVVKVTDSGGNAVPGVAVAWAAASGGGSVQPGTGTSGADGTASTLAALGPKAGANTFTASSASLTGSPVVFAATSTAGPAANLAAFSGNAQTGQPNSTLGLPLVVQATDSNGNPVSGIAVTFAAGAGGGSVTPTSAVTAANGTASTAATLGPTTSTSYFTATSGALIGSPVTFWAGAAMYTNCNADGDCCPSQYCNVAMHVCVDEYIACATTAMCSLAGQHCTGVTGSGSDCTSVAASCYCAFAKCSSSLQCPYGQSCFNGFCVGAAPCGGGCPAGQVCVTATNRCSVAPNDQAGSCHQTCPSAAMLVLAPPNNYDNYWGQCTLVAESCVCVQKP